jgi:hypothetical protein
MIGAGLGGRVADRGRSLTGVDDLAEAEQSLREGWDIFALCGSVIVMVQTA